MIEHLTVSTIILALAMLAARVLPLTARTRHAILLCGLAKFAIPSSLLGLVGVQTIKVLPLPQGVLATATAAAPATRSIDWILVGWAATATVVMVRWLLLRTRTIAAALRSPAPPSPRELDALAAARRILGVRTAVDLLRSPVCEAPAVLRVIRPVIILPARGCDDLSDDELRALLLHELAHVARRDNFTSALAAVAASLLWFHPLVWLALRQIDAAREQACDERVAEAMEQTGTYLDALVKVCRAAVSIRTAGAACMAGANIKERMEHLMNYESIRKQAWSHRGIVAAALVVIAAATAFAADVRSEQPQLYSLRFTITPSPQQVVYDVSVIDNATGTVVTNPRLTAPWGEWASINDEHAGRTFEVRMRMPRNGEAELLLTARSGQTVQRSRYTWQPVPPAESKSEYDGEPINLTLKGADIRDVMNAFEGMTGLEIEVAPEVEGKVTLDAVNMPWDEALVKAATQVGASVRVEGKTIRITK